MAVRGCGRHGYDARRRPWRRRRQRRPLYTRPVRPGVRPLRAPVRPPPPATTAPARAVVIRKIPLARAAPVSYSACGETTLKTGSSPGRPRRRHRTPHNPDRAHPRPPNVLIRVYPPRVRRDRAHAVPFVLIDPAGPAEEPRRVGENFAHL